MSVLAMARAQLPEVGGLTGLFTLLAWAKPGAAVEQEGEGAVAVAQIMSSQELMLLMESVTEGDKIAGLAGEEAAAPYIEAAAHMMINVITSATAGLGHREAVVEEGAVELALSWLDKYTENAQICRAASTLLVVLLQLPKGAERLNEEEFAGLATLIDVLDRSVPQDAAAEQDEEGDANTTVYFNALLAPTLDIVEKLMLCLFRALKTSTKARNRAMELGVVTKVFRILGAAKSSVLYARGICGVLNVLLEGPQIPGEGEEESALAVLEEVEEENVEARLVAMMESDLLQVLIKSLRYNVGDFAIAGVSALIMRASPTAAAAWWPVQRRSCTYHPCVLLAHTAHAQASCSPRSTRRRPPRSCFTPPRRSSTCCRAGVRQRCHCRQAAVAYGAPFGDGCAAAAEHTLLLLLRAGSKKTRQVQPFAISLLILSLYHMTASPTAAEGEEVAEEAKFAASARKERLVELNVLQALLQNMKVHKKDRMVQESSYLAISALTEDLPEDVLEQLPEYMGITNASADDGTEDGDEPAAGGAAAEEEEDLDAGGPVRYEIKRKAALRAGFELDSEQIGILEMGDVITVVEHKKNENGQTRVRTEIKTTAVDDEGNESEETRMGWTSITSRDGNLLMARVKAGAGADGGAAGAEAEDEQDPILAKAKEVMQLFFSPLKTFPNDQNLLEATLFSARTVLAQADILKTAVGHGPPLALIVGASNKHGSIPGVAENCFATLGALVTQHKQNQKKLRAAGGPDMVAMLLKTHLQNKRVSNAGMRCLKLLTTSQETARMCVRDSSSAPFCSA
jgi:hypothetical protein